MATGTKRDCRGVNCWRQLYRPIASTGDAALARHRIRDPVIPASSAPHRSSAAAAGSDATATATDSKDASRNSSARAFAAPACGASEARRPGSVASPSPIPAAD